VGLVSGRIGQPLLQELIVVLMSDYGEDLDKQSVVQIRKSKRFEGKV